MARPKADEPVNQRDAAAREAGTYDVNGINDRLYINSRRVDVGLAPKWVNLSDATVTRLKGDKHKDVYSAYLTHKKMIQERFRLVNDLATKDNIALMTEDEAPSHLKFPRRARPKTSFGDAATLRRNISIAREQRVKEDASEASTRTQTKSHGKPKLKRKAAESSDDDEDDEGQSLLSHKRIKPEPSSDDKDVTASAPKPDNAKSRILEEEKPVEQPVPTGAATPAGSDNAKSRILEEEKPVEQPVPTGAATAVKPDNVWQEDPDHTREQHKADQCRTRYSLIWRLLDQESRAKMFSKTGLNEQNPKHAKLLADIDYLHKQVYEPSPLVVSQGLTLDPKHRGIVSLTKDSALAPLVKQLGKLKRNGDISTWSKMVFDHILTRDEIPDGIRAFYAIELSHNLGEKSNLDTQNETLNMILRTPTFEVKDEKAEAAASSNGNITNTHIQTVKTISTPAVVGTAAFPSPRLDIFQPMPPVFGRRAASLMNAQASTANVIQNPATETASQEKARIIDFQNVIKTNSMLASQDEAQANLPQEATEPDNKPIPQEQVKANLHQKTTKSDAEQAIASKTVNNPDGKNASQGSQETAQPKENMKTSQTTSPQHEIKSVPGPLVPEPDHASSNIGNWDDEEDILSADFWNV